MDTEERLRQLLAPMESMDVRCIGLKSGSGWRVKQLYAKPYESEPCVPERVMYPQYLYLRAKLSVPEFLALLDVLKSPEAPILVQGETLTHHALSLNGYQHFPGYVRWGMITSPFPTWHFGGSWNTLSGVVSQYDPVGDPLVGGDDTPYFPRAIDGEAWYLFEQAPVGPNPSLPDLEISIIDRRAYFTGIDIDGDSYTVHSEGAAIDRCRLHLYTSLPHVEGKPAELESIFHIDGEPDTIAFALICDGEWLDRREVNVAGLARWNAEDVRMTSDADETLSIKELIARRGESLILEFKSNAGEPGKPAEKNRFLKTVVALANTQGGIILVGVDDDQNVIGIQPPDSKERIQDLIEQSITGAPHVEIVPDEVDGKIVLVVRVDAGADKPYGLICDTNKYMYYVRRDGSNKFAKPEDIWHMLPNTRSQHWSDDRLPFPGYPMPGEW